MAYLMGLDVGTSGLKAFIFNENGAVVSGASKDYGIDIPNEGYAEQKPNVWWEAAKEAIRMAIDKSGIKSSEIKCIGLSGQMHSIVLLDKNQEVIRPSIIWCDQRTQEQVNELYEKISKNKLGQITLNPIATGFSVVSLMWLKKYEPRSYERINKLLLPKDYMRFKLTGETGTDYSDASGTMLFDGKNRKWSDEILKAVGIDKNILPDVNYSGSISGRTTKNTALDTGLKEGIPVVCGGGDQSMQAAGNGIIESGIVSSTIGTGGQILMLSNRPDYDKLLRIHSYCNGVNDSWHIIGGTLCAGLSLKWLKGIMFNDCSYMDIDNMAEKIPAGSEGLIFMPYLIGERTPHMNPDAKGMFFGLSLKHEKAAFARAVMEGVAFSLKDSLEIFKELKFDFKRVIASGGGAQSRLWRQIQADVFGMEIYVTNTKEQACTGAAMTAAIGCGIYKNIEEACKAFVSYSDEVIKPDMKNNDKYNDIYIKYKALYKNNLELFGKGD